MGGGVRGVVLCLFFKVKNKTKTSHAITQTTRVYAKENRYV